MESNKIVLDGTSLVRREDELSYLEISTKKERARALALSYAHPWACVGDSLEQFLTVLQFIFGYWGMFLVPWWCLRPFEYGGELG